MTTPLRLPNPERWTIGSSPRPSAVRAVGTTTAGASILALAATGGVGWALALGGAAVAFVSGFSTAVGTTWKMPGYGKAHCDRHGWLSVRYPYANQAHRVNLSRLMKVRADFAGTGRLRYYVQDDQGNEAHLGACSEVPQQIRDFLDERIKTLPVWRRERRNLT